MSEDVTGILNKIDRTAGEYTMIPKEGKMIVGVSGGADSMALLRYLTLRADKRRIIAAHVNHGIRGGEADRDELFVKRFCEENEIAFSCLHADVPAMSLESGLGEEECGRNVRYGYFFSLASGENDRIYTAHTLSDSCETVLMRLVSGTGVGGLKGISPVRGKIMRPLIALKREEVERLCAAWSLSFCTDSTNLSEAYTRNFLRLRVIPLMRELNPALEDAVFRLSEAAGEDDAFLSVLAKRALGASPENGGRELQAFRELPAPVLRRALLMLTEGAGCGRMDHFHLKQAEEMIRAGQGSLSLPGGVRLLIDQEKFFLLPAAFSAEPFSLPYREPGVLLPDGRTVRIVKAEPFPAKSPNIHNLFATDPMSCGIIEGEILVRNRREGDCFTPPRRKVKKKLKKLQNELSVPAHLRDRSVVLEWRGEIVWVEGIGPSDRFSVTGHTETAASVQISES